ncbi:uncharacterized protein LOC135476866 [Liolophura sinensis]|uniref:uncharacterized protein LOC135476866 n=1 Tax=Liolophura sinensis TaxID=3198878 RepID=UPI0031593954
MEKKAHKFVALLAKKFTDACHKDIDHLEVFMLAVSNLKEGRLKSELQGNCSKYQEKFESELQGLKAEDRKVEVSSDDTSFVTRCHRVADRLEHMMLNSSELQQWVETVKKEGNSKLDHPELRALCSLLCCREDYVSLVNSMFLILSSVQGHVESCLADQDRARAVRLQRELHTILTFLYIKHGNLKGKKHIPGRQKYEDVLASLLSLYVDLVLLTSRSSETPVKVSKELCSFVFLLLSPWPAHVVDVLIQSSLPCSPDVTTVLPLARKCLKSPPIKPDCRTYTKYVVCLRSIVSALGEEVKDICQVAKSVKAPKSYLSWLREQREDLLDNLPEDRKFKGRVITQFLLHEADDALIDGLLDILTEELPEAREATEQSVSDDLTKQKSLAEETPSEDMPLFYVDKKGKDDKGNQGVKNGNEGTMGDKDGSEVIEVIEVDLSGFDMQPNEDALLHLNEDSDLDDVDEGNDLDDVDKGRDLDDIEEGNDLDDDNESNDLVIDDDDNDGDGALAMKTYLNAAACDVDDGDEDSDVEVIDIAENKADDSDMEVIDIAENKADDSDVEVIDIAENKADDSDVEGIDIAEYKADDRDVKGDDADGLVHKDNKDVDNADCDSDDSNDDDDDKAETQSSDEDTASICYEVHRYSPSSHQFGTLLKWRCL